MLREIFGTFLQALFPLSTAENALFSYSPEQAWHELPRAVALNPVSTPALVPYLGQVSAIFSYKDPRVSKLVWQVKYNKSAQAVKIGGFVLWSYLSAGSEVALRDTPSEPAGSAAGSHSPALAPKRPSEQTPAPLLRTIIIPVPITPKRRRERGFNQCELLADEIGKLDIQHRFKIEKELLIRTHHSNRQTLKNRADRLENSKGIFSVNEEAANNYRVSVNSTVSHNTFVIIDDVITTGSTMSEAIATMKNAGFENVYGLSLAH